MGDREQGELDTAFGRLADGDRAALDAVFAMLSPLVGAFCGKLVGPALAEDATQLALVKVFERASDFEPGRKVLPWVFAIAAWECRTLRTKARRSKEAAVDAPEVADAAATPEQMVQEHELINAALHALGTLSAADQQALRDAFWDHSEAPKEAAARKRKERALSRLRLALRRLYGW
jgi:RNA polymerase sigma factor (sigma-70 family)